MDTEFLKSCMKEIKVYNRLNEDVEVVNKSPLSMIGKGHQGAVFRFTDDICVKVFGNTDDCEREYYALSLGQHTNLFPKVHAKGALYIAMDIVNGVDLREYLQSQPLTEELSMKLIELLITFKKIGFERIDHHKRQIYLQTDGSLKVIDVARTVWRDRVYPYPRKLINSLGEENKKIFLSHVQALSPELYEEWTYYIEMENLSSQLFQQLLSESRDRQELKVSSNILLTPKTDKDEYQKLEDLAYKVFKNEWIKVMLAKGVNLEKIMEKIDDYWDNAAAGRTSKIEKFDFDFDDEEYDYPAFRGFYTGKSKKENNNPGRTLQGYLTNNSGKTKKRAQVEKYDKYNKKYKEKKRKKK